MSLQPTRDCPSREVLLGLGQGELAHAQAETVRNHVVGCTDCAEVVDAQARAAEPEASKTRTIAPPPLALGDATRGPGASAEGASPDLPMGTQLGRYTLLEKLGQGGMGVVYLAHDSELHRKVAIKLLHLAQGADATLGKERLLREAQALAQLSHPNVVGVHEVGTFGDRVFMAMDFVEGKTLRAWLKEKPGWREVLRVFLEAGAGLLAAHQKGLIHRDFKPDNVLLSADGRVHVLDFGLARSAVDESLPPAAGTKDAGAPTESLSPRTEPNLAPAAGSSPGFEFFASGPSAPLTVAGQLMGTPAYMAPELFQGSPADIRTDLFAFAVSLYEGLYGERPYAAPARLTLRPPPKGVRIPAWLRQVVLRGIALDPQSRPASFESLLAALRDDPGPRRRRTLLGLGVVGLVAAAAFGTQRLVSQRGKLCQGEAARLQGVWDAPLQQRLRTAFLATGVPGAAAAWEHTRALAEQYAQAIVQERTQACVDTRIHGSQSDETLTLRMACLDRRLNELKAFTDVFSTPTASMVADAASAATKLTPLEGCNNLAALRAPVPLPDDAATQKRIAAVRWKLARVHALSDARKSAEALVLAKEAAEEAKSLRYRPLEAEANEWMGAVLIDLQEFALARKTLNEAFAAALAGKHPEMAAEAANNLIYLESEVGSVEGGLQWSSLASASLEAIGGSPSIAAHQENSLGVLLMNTQPKEAEAHFRKELELVQRIGGVYGERKTMVTNTNLAALIGKQPGRLDELTQLNKSSLAVAEKLFGPTSVFVGILLSNAALGLEGELGSVDDVVAYQQRALQTDFAADPSFRCEVFATQVNRGQLHAGLTGLRSLGAEMAKVFGTTSRSAVQYQMMLSAAELALHHTKEAEDAAKKALAPASVERGDLAPASAQMAAVLEQRGQLDEARRYLEKARAVAEKDADAAQEVPAFLVAAAGFELRHGQPKKARLFAQKALTMERKALPAHHSAFADAYEVLGEAELGVGEEARAQATLEEATRRMELKHAAPAELARSRFALARALAKTDVKRSRALAERALADYDASEAPVDRERAAVQAWLARP